MEPGTVLSIVVAVAAVASSWGAHRWQQKRHEKDLMDLRTELAELRRSRRSQGRRLQAMGTAVAYLASHAGASAELGRVLSLVAGRAPTQPHGVPILGADESGEVTRG